MQCLWLGLVSMWYVWVHWHHCILFSLSSLSIWMSFTGKESVCISHAILFPVPCLFRREEWSIISHTLKETRVMTDCSLSKITLLLNFFFFLHRDQSQVMLRKCSTTELFTCLSPHSLYPWKWWTFFNSFSVMFKTICKSQWVRSEPLTVSWFDDSASYSSRK